MSEADLDLPKLLAPWSEETFFHAHWEKQPLHLSRGAANYYGGLFSSADVDAVIAFTRPKFGDAGAFRPGVPRQKSFVQGWLADRPIEDGTISPGIDDLQRVYAQGRTVVIMTMQQRWPAIAALCRNLERFFHCPVHANLYLTPAGAQGFDVHFDTHEVFILQLEGHKTWRLYGAARTLPLVGERFSVPREHLGPAREIRLAPGDLLYLPRGHAHEAFTAQEASMHLTVGVNVYRWADLLHEALASLAHRDERFRAALPPGLLDGGAPPAALTEPFRELLGVLLSEARAEEAVRALGDRFFEQMPALPGGYFTAAAQEEAIDLDTVLEKVPGALCRVVEEGAWVTIESPGVRVGGPLKIASALRFVATGERFPVRALPDDLGGEGKLVLARRLVRERLLRVAHARRAWTESGEGEPAAQRVGRPSGESPLEGGGFL
jgi:ribosomal protein L16 Arg81 hydroxylase